MRALVLVVAWVALCGVARADDEKQAAAHYKQGKAFFDAKLYPKAIEEYEKAYVIDRRPAHLFNIARAYQLAGDPKKAIEIYQRFLAAEPDGPTAAEARKHIVEATTALPTEPDAAARDAERKEQARRDRVTAHLKQAETHLAAELWASAGAEFLEAAESSGDPSHLLAAGDAFRKQPDLVRARAAYTAYLERVPAGANSDAIRAVVTELTKQLAQPVAAETAAPATGVHTATPVKKTRGWGGGIMAGAVLSAVDTSSEQAVSPALRGGPSVAAFGRARIGSSIWVRFEAGYVGKGSYFAGCTTIPGLPCAKEVSLGYLQLPLLIEGRIAIARSMDLRLGAGAYYAQLISKSFGPCGGPSGFTGCEDISSRFASSELGLAVNVSLTRSVGPTSIFFNLRGEQGVTEIAQDSVFRGKLRSVSVALGAGL